jgi:cytochrome c biogenesis protein CcdA
LVRHHGELGRAAYYLVLIGGVLLVVLGLLALVGYAISIPIPLPGMSFGFVWLPMILGIVAIILAKRVTELVWAIILIVVGFLGGGIGGILVLLGGLLGLLSHFI